MIGTIASDFARHLQLSRGIGKNRKLGSRSHRFLAKETYDETSRAVRSNSSDRFKKPYPFEADIAVAIDDVFEQKIDALTALESQVFEGGALASAEIMDSRPPASQPDLRREWLRERWDQRAGREAQQVRQALNRWYGAERGEKVLYAEAFEICEYGRQPSEDDIRILFPFFEESQ